MWPFTSSRRTEQVQKNTSPILLTNTLGGKKEQFHPLKPGVVKLYSCGFTVYNQAHIGNIRPYVFADTLARVLKSAGYHVRRVINITDVGHLVSDSDEGEDKMEVGARREGVSAEEIANRYTNLFLEDLRAVGIDTNDVLFPRATQYISEQIAMVKTLEEKGYTYRTHDGIYFDTSKFAGYGKLGGISEAELKSGDATTLEDRVTIAAGRRISENKEKRHPADFAVWKFSPAGAVRQQEWQSPWGRGFPGWHLECSAMVRALLGDTIDIHTGGIDHIPIHHNNEIAQSEGALGHPFVKYWMHNGFLTIDGEKISKSIGNVVYLSDITKRGIDPLALRYFFLQAHYRSQISFTWEALEASAEALNRLWRLSARVLLDAKGQSAPTDASERILALVDDDLGTPQALAYLWETLRDDELLPKEKRAIIEAIDPIFGLSLMNPPEFARTFTIDEVPDDIRSVVKDREKARLAHDFEKADALREKLRNRGYHVEDGHNGPLLTSIAK